MNIEARLSRLEQRPRPAVERQPIRIFDCHGRAEDGGPPRDESARPDGLAVGQVWCVAVCLCSLDEAAS